MALARLKMFPLSKSAPLAICAFMILSVSSNKMGMKRSAMDIIMATSCTDEDVLSYIAFPNLAEKFFEERKAKEENVATYSIVEC
mgnify:CR=1 FL=1